MKKILSLILAGILFAVSLPVVSFAETTVADNLFGVIIDAEGNVVEVLPMTRTTYVNSIYTIPAGGQFISFQYEPSENFSFGFYSITENGSNLTTAGSRLKTAVEVSKTIGGDGKKVWGSYEWTVNKNQFGYFIGPDNVKDYDYRYYNGVLTNNSSYSVTVRVIVCVDGEIPL